MTEDNHKDVLTTRKFKLKLDKVATRYWLGGSAVKTLHANAFTTGIPFGERFFLSCILPYIRTIKCPLLRKNAVEFARQEINHSREHLKLYVKAVKPFYPKLKVKGSFYQILSVGIALLVGKKIRLAMVTAVEHYTAVVADWYLSNPSLFDGSNEKIIALLRWHSIEELEHRAVAFDIFKACQGNYFQRVVGFFLAGFIMFIGFFNYFFHMVIYDKLYLSAAFYRESFRFFCAKKGILRQLAIPILSYLHPSFHPHKTKQYSSQVPMFED